MSGQDERSGRIDLAWVRLGVAGGVTACVAHPLVAFAPLPPRAAVVLAALGSR